MPLVKLAEQLGYPCLENVVKERIKSYINNNKCRILVAEIEGKVVGWASLDLIQHFYIDPFVEISGFVVDENYRNRGIGREIIKEIEVWTKIKKCKIVRLKTNTKRIDAHRFYENNGFKNLKEQIVYVKEMK